MSESLLDEVLFQPRLAKGQSDPRTLGIGTYFGEIAHEADIFEDKVSPICTCEIDHEGL